MSSQFPIAPLPADNRLGMPEGRSGTGVADGVYPMVRPLGVGNHTVHTAGEFVEPFAFVLDTTITLRVRR